MNILSLMMSSGLVCLCCTFSNFTMFRDRLGALCLNRAWTLGVSAESLQVTLTWIPLLSGLLGGKETTVYWCQAPQMSYKLSFSICSMLIDLCKQNLLTECCRVTPLSQAFSSSITVFISSVLLTVNSSLWLWEALLRAWLSTDTWPLPENQRQMENKHSGDKIEETWSE